MRVYHHTATSPVLQSVLHTTLPYSINLVYRTQHPNRTKDAHILATFPENAETTQPIPECWAAAYLDRSMRPETELWIFATGEMPGHSTTTEEQFCPTCKEAILSLISYMSTLPTPPLLPENQKALDLAKQHEKEFPETGPDVRYPPSPGAYTRHLLLPNVVSLGAVHDRVAQICQDTHLTCPQFPGLESRLTKFLFRISDLPRQEPLPSGYQWTEMNELDLDFIQSRTPIPRPRHTLLSMKNVAVSETETNKVVAWVFLGLDGSLTTLHVEAEHRGRRIAKAIVSRLLRQYANGLAVDGDGNSWAHADVYDGNIQGGAVCRGLGASKTWPIFWIRIQLADS